jgi:hypothetical protein
MKKLFLILFSALSVLLHGQTVIQHDYMETWSTGYATSGWWTPATTATWATNISVSPTQSAVIYGLGNGTSGNEQDWYSLPNITGLNTSHPYQLKFRLASRTFTGSAAATRGVDATDLVEVQVSRNGGAYVSELRIIGNSNATWSYTATGVINHNANGSFTNSLAPIGDVYQAPAGPAITTAGPSTVTLNIPSGISQIAIDIFCRVNSAGEEWWIDNIQLIEIFPLPIELVSFESVNLEGYNLLTWSSASEQNNDYYLLERSTDGYDWSVINNQKGAGNSSVKIDYSFRDFTYEPTINYYRLSQVDFDGNSETFKIISVNNLGKTKQILFLTNILGQIVGDEATGILIAHYVDGASEKIYK